MLYYITHERSQVKIFNKDWTSSKVIFNDLNTVKKMFDIEDIDELTIHDHYYRFKICIDLNGYLQCGLLGRYFYTNVQGSRSYVIDTSDCSLVRVFTNDDLNKLLGLDVNGHRERA